MLSLGKSPTGFRYLENGELEAIPGGPADLKEGVRKSKLADAQERYLRKADLMDLTIDNALSKVGVFTAGPGALLANIPGTSAVDLEADMDTLRANIGFQELQDMRASSPTGGALGPVSDTENLLLQSVLGSMKQEQSPAQLRKRLIEIKESVKRMREAIKKDGAMGGASGPAVGTEKNGYRFKGGNPADKANWEKI
jgi:hypothetical protein